MSLLGAVSTLNDDFTWSSPDPLGKEFLTTATERLRRDLGPAQGDPLSYVFLTLAKETGAKILQFTPVPTEEPNPFKVY